MHTIDDFITRFRRLAQKAALGVGTLMLFTANFSSLADTNAATPQTPAPKDLTQVFMDTVVNKAKALAKKNYVSPEDNGSNELSTLNYDQYRGIRFNPAKALWHDQSLFEVQLFHPGFIYKEPITLQLVNPEGISQRVPFDSSLFTYGSEKITEIVKSAGPGSGYSGFRVHFPLNSMAYKDELAVFQGASYFRLVGPNQVYGLSARGLAIDTAVVSGEEFPRFTDFWLIQSAAKSNHLVILALLDSPSITGAFRFEIDVTSNTTAKVDAVLIPRNDIKKVGIAPLTSMFFFGESQLQRHDDIRHEVHDSDGLLMQTGSGRWIWRPLSNPKSLNVTSMLDSNPRGFGLAQRDRDFENYLDAEAHYQDRPSLWVQPEGDWGEGHVELVEIPSDMETNDNIVAYWVPSEPFLAGQERRFSYTLTTFNSLLPQQNLATVNRTLIGWSALPGEKNPPPRSERRFAIDFTGSNLEGLSKGLPLSAKVETSSGKLSDISVVRLPDDSGWRVVFRLQPEEDAPADIRAFLSLHGEQLSEEWSYVWNPNIIAN